ncbi:uncharacterized protein LOC110024660 [Phalaenopsis equestris]|uniref:uncharacterized protein LOC110024660 n=1 Tax=Phalaenopsis equestris TaxID=78828 RepID=UPI0009E5B103|nr:uncharacterized protein LOC110024660 [Phalaenopsis equestris]
MNRFNDFFSDVEIFDLGYYGPDFTWRRSSMWERLDRMLGNSKWVQTFPFTVISHLTMADSDHRPLLCTIQNVESPFKAPFRFQNMWTLHPQFVEVVGKLWRSEDDTNLWINLWKLQKKVVSKLRKWNRDTYGNIRGNLIKAQSKVISMEDSFQRGLIFEVDLHKANEELLLHISYTECFLKQKVVVTKFMEGDRNLSYYHACINFKRKNNLILSIQDSAGHVLTNAENIA